MEGFGAHAYAEGGAALQDASENSSNVWPDLVFLDLYTEAMSASDFVQGLGSLASQLGLPLPKICVVSGAADIEAISRQLNADFFFQKPFEIPELIEYAKLKCAQEMRAG
jgi:response regulator RpfG family c-di-GMP phosphodiesterase